MNTTYRTFWDAYECAGLCYCIVHWPGSAGCVISITLFSTAVLYMHQVQCLFVFSKDFIWGGGGGGGDACVLGGSLMGKFNLTCHFGGKFKGGGGGGGGGGAVSPLKALGNK